MSTLACRAAHNCSATLGVVRQTHARGPGPKGTGAVFYSTSWQPTKNSLLSRHCVAMHCHATHCHTCFRHVRHIHARGSDPKGSGAIFVHSSWQGDVSGDTVGPLSFALIGRAQSCSEQLGPAYLRPARGPDGFVRSGPFFILEQNGILGLQVYYNVLLDSLEE